MIGVIDRCSSKIFWPKHSTDPLFKATHAKKTVLHSGGRPQFVADHVVLPAIFMTAAAFASAWRGIHAAIFTM